MVSCTPCPCLVEHAECPKRQYSGDDSDQNKVRCGNLQQAHARRYVGKCLNKNIPGYLENPRTSRFWKLPWVLRLVAAGRAQLVDFDMCQYGTQWRKPTRLLVWNVPTTIELLRCSGKQGLCSRTHKPHLLLSGVAKGRFLTAAAQVYPPAFATALKHICCPLCHPP